MEARAKNARKKCFVLDTSVLLYSAKSIFSFGGKDVILPLDVLDELDKFKSANDENGRNARQVIRQLHELRQAGNLADGVPVGEKGGRLFTISECEAPSSLSNNVDNRILGACKKLTEQAYDEVVLITKDINLALKADGLRIPAQDFVEDSRIKQADELYTGFDTIEIAGSVIDSLYANKVHLCDISGVFPNQFLLLQDVANSKHTALARVSSDTTSLGLVKKPSAWGIEPRNLQQTLALDILLDTDIPLVTLVGMAGTGKSFLAVAAGLQQVLENRQYDTLVITRPTVPVGKFSDIGFLPGDMLEKYRPWIQPIQDQVEVLFGSQKGGEQQFEELLTSGVVKIAPLAYIRGRSFHSSLIIIDEAQQMTKHEVKTFLTRAGENCKIIMTGDTYQIDNPFIDSVSNGLTQVVERFKAEAVAAHITLTKCERSTLASIAATIL